MVHFVFNNGYREGGVPLDRFQDIFTAIQADAENKVYTERGIGPLYSAPKEAKVCVVGQAPGVRAQDSGLYWNDPSGDRLREWMGVDREVFYGSPKLAILPMDFYFPGRGQSGDLPPRPGFAEKWHPPLLELLPALQIFLLIGAYAQRYYLGLPTKARTTETVQNFRDYLPKYIPLVHPSPRNNLWLKRNPWFEKEVVPYLKETITALL